MRGHLRFWWRACQARRYSTTAELLKAETSLWGHAAVDSNGHTGPAPIEVAVEILSAGEETPGRFELGSKQWTNDQCGYPSYALFPFQENRRQRTPPAKGRVGVRFRLRLLPAPHVDPRERPRLLRAARAAVWAWVTFGGVGARTRRGCGSLLCSDPAFLPTLDANDDPSDWLRQ